MKIEPLLANGKIVYCDPDMRGEYNFKSRSKVFVCECGRKVAFRKSKTGKSYLVNCFENRKASRHDSELYMGSEPHYLTCEIAQKELREKRELDETA